MAGPGGHEAERLSVKVVPDTDGFYEKVKALLESLDEDVEVGLKLKGEEKIEARLKELAEDITVRVNLVLQNAANVRAQLARLQKDLTVHLNVEVDAALARAKIERLLNNRALKINVDLDLQKARIEMAVFLRPRTLKVHVDFDRNGFQQAFNSMAQFGRMVGSINRQMSNMGRMAGAAFSSTSSAASSTTGAFKAMRMAVLPLVVVLGTVLVAALAGLIVALVAVVGGLLAMLPPIAFIGAGLFYLFKSGDKQAKKFRKSLDGIVKTSKSVLRTAVKPMSKAISEQVPITRKWIAQMRGPLKTAFTQSSRYVDVLAAGVRQFGTNILKGLGEALASPGLKVAAAGFSNLISDIGTALGEFFKALGEGGADYHKTLSTLGDSLIKLAPALARLSNEFAKFAPEIIDALTNALLYLFDVLGNHGNLTAIAKAAKVSFFVIVGILQGIIYAVRFQIFLWESMWAIIKWVVNGIRSLWNSFTSWMSSKWDSMTRKIFSSTSGMKASVTGQFSGMVGRITGLVGGLVGRISSFWSRITGRTRSGANSTRSSAIGPFAGMADSISGIMSSIVSIVSSAWSRISGIVSQIAGAVSRARASVGGLGGLLDKLNPFSLTVPDAPMTMMTMAGPATAGLLSEEPVYTLRSDSIFDDVDRMANESRSLRAQARKARKGNENSSSSDSFARRVYNFTTYAAPNEPTEKQFSKWMDYMDTLHGTA